MRVIARAKLKDLRGVLDGDVTVTRAGMLKRVEKIEMGANGKASVASGNWNFIGSYLGMVPGARIELATPAFSGRRSTTELPRQLWFRNCRVCGAIVSIRLK